MGNSKDSAREAIDNARQATHDAVDTAMQTAHAAIDTAKKTAATALESAQASIANNAAAAEERREQQRKLARSRKLKSVWQNTKRKNLSSIRKLHIIGPIIAMLVMPVLFVAATAGIMFGYFTIVSTGWTDDAVLKYTIMASRAAEQAEKGTDTAQIDYAELAKEAGFAPNDSIVVVDTSTGELLYKSGSVELDESAGQLRLFDKSAVDINLELWAMVLRDMKNKSFVTVLSELLDAINDTDKSVAGWLRQDAISFSDWVNDGKFNEDVCIYVYSPLRLSNEQVMTVYLIIFFAAIMSLIPFLFYLVGSIRNVISWHRTRKVYYYDPICLTNNWQYLSDRAERILRKIPHASNRYSVVCLHMDKYQNYCICYGKEDGEWLLWKIAQTLTSELGKGELCARNSGAEFGLLLKTTDREAVENRVTAIVSKLKGIVPERNVSFGCGIAEIADGKQTIDDWFYYAGIARGSIDENNIKRIVWYDDEMKNERLWVKHVEERMYQALANNEFQVYIQPKHNPVNDEMTGGEALIRWNSPEDGFIVPGRFIPIFEQNGFITNIDNFMVSSVALLQSTWLSQGMKIVPISVNLSRAHFAEPNLAEQICAMVDQYNVPHDKIELEITESAFFDDRDALLSTVRKLKGMGFEISMDDFGTGYSSMNSLRELPLDVLKLDAGFFRGNQEDGRGAIVVEDAIKLAKHLNMQVVAEGVEKKEQVEFLAQRDCDMIQGYYYAKPMPASEFAQRLGAGA